MSVESGYGTNPNGVASNGPGPNGSRRPSDPLAIDPELTVEAISDAIRSQIQLSLHRRGAVVGLSGGIDSSVVAALCVRTLGPNRVLGLMMPERDSSDDALHLARLLATHLGIETIVENITGALEGTGCYVRQAEAIRTVFPDYDDRYRCKLSLPSILDGDRFNITRLTVRAPSGEEETQRLPVRAYLQLVAATNMKQRVRTMLEYYHADRLNYAVAGTPNRLEYDQGFFVKQGDGAADFKPIAHLYKTQVYALARHLDLPKAIQNRPPTTDTFSMAQTQEEFYFALPYDRMDICLYGHNHKIPASETAAMIGVTPEQAERIYRDIESKRRATHYLHLSPLLVEPVREI